MKLIIREYELKIKEWWANLAVRERKMLGIGGVIVFLLLIYLVFWSPLLEHIALMRAKIVANQQLLVWMQAADKEIQNPNAQVALPAKINSAVMLLNILRKGINQFGLEKGLTQLKQSGNETIEIHFQKVEFDQVVKFLLSVTKQYSITISQATIVAEGAAGVVNVDLFIKF